MKLRLPNKLMRALVSALMFAASSQVVFSQTLQDWEDYDNEKKPEKQSYIATWGSLYLQDENPALIPTTGSYYLMPDGQTSPVAADTYVGSYGYLTDAAGSHLTGSPLMEDIVVLGSDMTVENGQYVYVDTLLAGTIIMPTIDYGDKQVNFYPPVQNVFSLADQGSYNRTESITETETRVVGTEIRVVGFAANSTGIVAGRAENSYGSADDRKITRIWVETYMPLANNLPSNDLGWVVGGNANTLATSAATGARSDFYGDSYIVLEENISSGKVIGGNYFKNNLLDETPAVYNGDFYGSTHISAKSGSYASTIVGGNYLQKFDFGETEELGPEGVWKGDFYGTVDEAGDLIGGSTIIIHDGTSAGQVIGGNLGNDLGSSYSGHTKVTVHGQSGASQSLDLIVGASYLDSSYDTSFTGSTNININALVDANGNNTDDVGYVSSESGVYGGFSGRYFLYSPLDGSIGLATDFEGKTATLNGDTNVTIDLSDVTGISNQSTFNALIAGGSIAGNGLNINQTGTATVTFSNLSDAQFVQYVSGGNINYDIDGVQKSGSGTEYNYIKGDQSSTYLEKAVVNVDSGDFVSSSPDYEPAVDPANLFVVGSLTLGGGEVTTNETVGNISGGSFGLLIGGNAASAGRIQFGDGYGVSSEVGVITPGQNPIDSAYISVKQYLDPEDPNYYKSYVYDAAVGTSVVNSVTLDITGGSSSMVVGGSYISNIVTHIVSDNNVINTQALKVGDASTTISGGVHGDIVGGSYVGVNIVEGKALSDGGSAINYEAQQGHMDLIITGTSTEITGGRVAAAGMLGAKNNLGVSESDYMYQYYTQFKNIFENPGIEPLSPPPVYTPSASGGAPALSIQTDSTRVEIGKDVTFSSPTVVSGGYIYDQLSTDSSEGGGEEPPPVTITLDMVIQAMETDRGRITSAVEAGDITADQAQLYFDWIDSWESQLRANMEVYNGDAVWATQSDTLNVISNRQLVLNNGIYSNLDQVSFVDFDEISIDSNSQVDFSRSGQDLDLLNGRNQLDAGSTRVSFDLEGTALMTDENTLRKTGGGALLLDDVNGQANKATASAASSLQLVVEAGTVVLAKQSALTSQTDFKTLVVQSGATLDMRAGNYDVTGKYDSGNAGVNGDLLLEVGSILRADASRDLSGTGTTLEGGSLQIIGEGQITLKFDNLDLVETNKTATEGNLLFEAGAEYFQIVLFSGLSYYEDLLTNIQFDETLEGSFDGAEAKGTLASKYFQANFDLTDVYLVYNANGDILLTGSTFYIPEPSTATLSLLALTGLLARRRRKSC